MMRHQQTVGSCFALFAMVIAAELRADVRLNEVMSSNASAVADNDGDFSDWIEIYNPDDESVNLNGYGLSDSSSPFKWTFPNVTLQPGQFLVVWASNKDRRNPAAPLHTNFAISAAGERISLTAPDGTLVDALEPVAIPQNQSLGRHPDGTGDWLLFTQSTPGSTNTTTGQPAQLEAPIFSTPGGMFTAPIQVGLSTTVAGGVIRYTTDGSEPTESSPVYSAPIEFSSRAGTPNGISMIPTNTLSTGPPNFEGWQPPDGEVFKIHVLRARVFKAGSVPSRTVTHSYLIDPAGADRYPYPVVSIATDAKNFFDPGIGIYVKGNNNNYTRDGSAWERRGHIEFYETNGESAFHGTAGLRIHGGSTVTRPRKSLRIYCRDPGPDPKFQHQIFPDKDIGEFKTFILRNSGNDWGQTLFRDAFMTSLTAHTGLDRMFSRPAIVFINGEYWGIHNLRDRIDEGYYETHYGLAENEFTQLQVASGAPSNSWPTYDRGNPDLLADFEDILTKSASEGVVDPERYAALGERIDIDNFIDYQLFEIFFGNTDWPGNNLRLWRSVATNREPDAPPRHDGRWRWVLYDTDFGFGLDFNYVPGWGESYNHNTLAFATAPTATSWANAPIATRLLRRCLDNATFRRAFINRFADQMNTALSSSHIDSQITQWAEVYEPAMEEHVQRWRQPADWSVEINRLRNYAAGRPNAVRGHICTKFGLPGTAELTILSNPDKGSVQVNTIALDSSTPGVAAQPFPWTGTYFQEVPVTLTATPKPGYRFVSWKMEGSAETIAAWDSTANYPPGVNSWTNTINGGTGFGPWFMYRTSTSTSGWFMGNSGISSHPIFSSTPDNRAFGIYAHSGHLANVQRYFDQGNLQIGQTFSAKLGMSGFSGSRGITFTAGYVTWDYVFWWAAYTESGNQFYSGSHISTAEMEAVFPLQPNSVFDFKITRLSNDIYRVVIERSGVTFTKDCVITRPFDTVMFYNQYTDGSADANNLYFNEVKLFTPAVSEEIHHSPTIEVTLSKNRTFTAQFESTPASQLKLTLPPVFPEPAGSVLPPIQVEAVDEDGNLVLNFSGVVTLTIIRPDESLLVLTSQAIDGVATFAGIIPEIAGAYSFSATAGDLTTTGPASAQVLASATFLPPGNGSWHASTNWSTGAIPQGTGLAAIIPGPAANRDINLNAPTIIGRLEFPQGSSSARNRVRDASGTSDNTLTFAATGTNEAQIIVGGTDTGYVEFESGAGVILSNQTRLTVTNIIGHAEFGALRLRETWTGPGGLTKDGPGQAVLTGDSKLFSGPIIIEQGVLGITGPSANTNSPSITVLDGGQLRLTSAGNPRDYTFGGPIYLAGDGRSGVGDGSGLGVLGALRYEPGSTGNNAQITTPVETIDNTHVHSPGNNTITFAGAFSGTHEVLKSGAGTFAISGNAEGFTGTLNITNGTLLLQTNLAANSTLTIAGNGKLQGSGERTFGNLNLNAGGSVIATLEATPSPNAIFTGQTVILTGASTVNATVATNSVAGRYPIAKALAGSIEGTGTVSLVSAPGAFPASIATTVGDTLYVVLGTTETETWRAKYGLPINGSGDGADDADPDNDGIPNLLEQALGLNPLKAESSTVIYEATAPAEDPAQLIVTYRVTRAAETGGIAVTPESTGQLTPEPEWTEASPTLIDDSHPDHRVYQVALPIQSGQQGFIRLKAERPLTGL